MSGTVNNSTCSFADLEVIPDAIQRAAEWLLESYQIIKLITVYTSEESDEVCVASFSFTDEVEAQMEDEDRAAYTDSLFDQLDADLLTSDAAWREVLSGRESLTFMRN